MEIHNIIGFLSASLIGILLGLIGGGGSILTVPVLVYLFGLNPITSTAYSLFVVGWTSAVGTTTYFKKKQVCLKTALYFSIPSFTSVFITRAYILPAIPNILFQTESFTLYKRTGIMILFALVMILAAVSMITRRKIKAVTGTKERKLNYPMIMLEGMGVGLLTGLVGAGGGFLIIPALVLFARLPMKLAVGTSLLIISIKSIIGFLGDVTTGQTIDWLFLIGFTAISILGIFIGTYLSNYISGEKLKKSFGWFVLIMAVYISYKEFYLL